MKIIAKYESGSKSYGLSTPESDNDISFLFLNDTIASIIGLGRHDHENCINKTVDSNGYELRHFLNLLRKGNTQSLEMLHNDIWVEKSDEMDFIQQRRLSLLDSETIFRTLKGYSYGERKLIFGTAHRGQIGEKRKKAVEKYGYSYRNASHAMRLIRAGCLFFKTDIYPVDIVRADKEYGDLIYSIKTNPSAHKPEDIEAKLVELEKELDDSFEKRARNYSFNDKVANDICYQLYMTFL